MENFLEKLRKKDDAQKIAISFVVAIVVTFVITATWLTWSFAKEDKKEVKEAEVSTEVTPISNLGSQASEIKSMFGQVMEQFQSSKDMIQAIPDAIEEQENASTTTTVNSTTTVQIESDVE